MVFNKRQPRTNRYQQAASTKSPKFLMFSLSGMTRNDISLGMPRCMDTMCFPFKVDQTRDVWSPNHGIQRAHSPAWQVHTFDFRSAVPCCAKKCSCFTTIMCRYAVDYVGCTPHRPLCGHETIAVQWWNHPEWRVAELRLVVRGRSSWSMAWRSHH